MAIASGQKAVEAFGGKYVFHQVPYDGSATSFSVDQTATVVSVVAPSSGPTVTLGAGSGSLKTVTVAAGGSNLGGHVVIVTAHGKGIASHGNSNF